jgi:cytochrome P450
MTLPPTTSATNPADAMFAWLHTMLDTQSVYLDDKQVWQVFGYADVARILSDPATFSSDITAFSLPRPDFDLLLKNFMIAMDPPRHRKQRTLVSQVFTPRLVTALAPRITEVTTPLLDSVDDLNRFDLIDALAYPLPVSVSTELLGVPTADQPRFRHWVETLLNQQTVDATASRRTGLVTALLGNAVLCLDRHPEAASAVRAERDLLPAAIEEILRYRPPVPRMTRVTTTDTEIGDHAILAGQTVISWIAAANRDAARFPEPDRFNIHRASTGHLAFGHGIHFCLGAPLARLVATIALGILLERYPDIAVDASAPLEFHNPWVSVSVKRLPVLVA